MKTCGLDVHKDTIFCAIYDGKDSVVEKFSTFTPDIEAMVQEPVARVERFLCVVALSFFNPKMRVLPRWPWRARASTSGSSAPF